MGLASCIAELWQTNDKWPTPTWRLYCFAAPKVEKNYIGVGKDGLEILPNTVGVLIDQLQGGSPSGNHIGGVKTGTPLDVSLGNVIAGNKEDGVRIANRATRNDVLGNDIGTSEFGNTGNGVAILNAP